MFINSPNGNLTILSALSYHAFKKHRVPTSFPLSLHYLLLRSQHTLKLVELRNQNLCNTLKALVCRSICNQIVRFQAAKFPCRNLPKHQKHYSNATGCQPETCENLLTNSEQPTKVTRKSGVWSLLTIVELSYLLAHLLTARELYHIYNIFV